MDLQYILGPAGSGKTWRCIAGMRELLRAAPSGPSLIFIAPKQATFQLERLLLSDRSIRGYTRVQILSFERFAGYILEKLGQPLPALLGDEGLSMALRSLLIRHGRELRTFHAAARLTGFASQLKHLLAEFNHYRITPEKLRKTAARFHAQPSLEAKLLDFARIQEHHAAWLKEHQLQDSTSLVAVAAEALDAHRHSVAQGAAPLVQMGGIWLDGFATLTPQELDLLAAVVPFCDRACLAFCLDPAEATTQSWLSTWFTVGQTFNRCRARLSTLPCRIGKEDQVLRLDAERGRFTRQPDLAHIERAWMNPAPLSVESPVSVRLVECASAEAEATAAAREILSHVRAGGRYRHAAVILRSLDTHHAAIRRVFARYEIPFFLDRREPIAHHPLAEVIRYSLRCAVFGCVDEDWFGWIKTGLTGVATRDADRLEIDAAAFGWHGLDWLHPLQLPSDPDAALWAEGVRKQALQHLQPFLQAGGVPCPWMESGQPIRGSVLVEGWRLLLQRLAVEDQLRVWAARIQTEQGRYPASVHLTVLGEIESWLANFELAFRSESLMAKDWLPVMEAGLSALTAGVIPPVLDQVLVGSVDRSRNPNLRVAILLGMNDGLFPAPAPPASLLAAQERDALELEGLELASGRFHHLATERYLGYIACTRASERLIVCWSRQRNDGSAATPSPFVARLRVLLPHLAVESGDLDLTTAPAVHPSELVSSLMRAAASTADSPCAELSALVENLPSIHIPEPGGLSPRWTAALHPNPLNSSVSRLEDFGACPFKFFIRSGMKIDQPLRFELDPRERGSFQHEVLSRFHDALASEGQRWRDVSPERASERVQQIATDLLPAFRDGLLEDSRENRFLARSLIESLQRFTARMVRWMSTYGLDPRFVELGFGNPDDSLPAWRVELDEGRALMLRGRIDRVDASTGVEGEPIRLVVMDYKSSEREMDDLLLKHGIQIQLPAYLSVLTHLPEFRAMLGAETLEPVGLFYANLRPSMPARAVRLDQDEDIEHLEAGLYTLNGRFRVDRLQWLDAQGPEHRSGQFRYRLKRDGSPYANERQALSAQAFEELLRAVETALRTLGNGIFSGAVHVAPYVKGTQRACDHCAFAGVCRIDPWTHQHYRILEPCRE